jgi:heme o synthase
MERIRAYYHLTKPGIIKGNLLVATAAYLYGSQATIDIPTCIGLLVGTSAIIACGCVVNNYYDRNIDRAMKRTSNRALVTGAISTTNALLFATVLGILGVIALSVFVNTTVLAVGIIGFVSYAFVYTVAKHRTVHATLIGTLPGATPPVAGYAAATGHVDTAAAILFVTMVAWQMAHFYAIAIFRVKEYKAAHVPVISIQQSVVATRYYIIGFIALFTAISPLLSTLGYASLTYGIVMAITGLYWLWISLQPATNPDKWARKVFGFSLVILLIFSALLALDAYLP